MVFKKSSCLPESEVAKALFVLVKGLYWKALLIVSVLTTAVLCVNQGTFVAPLNKQSKLPGRA